LTPTLQDWASPRREWVEQALHTLFADSWPTALGEMCAYPLRTGGKRMRPLLVLAAYEAVAKDPSDWNPALAPSVAIELVHTYSLVHDDLPCMDDDAERRGQPTVHVQYGDGAAVLVGDALLTEAFGVVTRSESLSTRQRIDLVNSLSLAAGHQGMIGGQAGDLALGGPVQDAETLLAIHRRKTGALIRSACEMGVIAGGGWPDEKAALIQYGEAVGLAFQLVDDLLDQDTDGPPSYPKLVGVDATRTQAHKLLEEALSALEALPGPVEPLAELARYTLDRTT
jgi:geranylgeranyl pyrophosphate synthase